MKKIAQQRKQLFSPAPPRQGMGLVMFAYIFFIMTMAFVYIGSMVYLRLLPADLSSASYTWSTAVVDTTNDTGKYSSIVSSGGVLHISYFDATDRLKYAKSTNNGTSWTTSIVDSGGPMPPIPVVGHYSSIAVNSAGNPVISYYDVTNGNLKLAVYDPATSVWTVYTLVSDGDVGQYTAIATDASAGIYVAYYDVTANVLKVVKTNTTGAISWSTTVTGAGGKDNSMVLSGSTLYISTNLNRGTLQLAKVTTAGAVTSVETIATGTSPSFGLYTSITLNSSSNPIISYYDASALLLRFAENLGAGATNGVGCNGTTGWNCTTIDGTTTSGDYTSIALNASNNPIISYHKLSSADLLVAEYVGGTSGTCTNTAWTCDVVDSTGGQGEYTDIVLHNNGKLYISYYSSSETELKVASSSVANTAPVVGYTSDNVIPTAQVSQATDGSGVLTITFKIKDAEQTSGFTLNSFKYSVVADNSFSTEDLDANLTTLFKTTSSTDWRNNAGAGYGGASTLAGASDQTFKFNTKSSAVSALNSMYNTGVELEFKANDGTVSSAFGVSQSFTLDNEAPTGGSVNDGSSSDIDYQSSTTSVTVNWSGFSDGSGTIASYQWAIGTTSGGEQTQAYTATGVSGLTATSSSLTLLSGTLYYVSVKALDSFGNSRIVTSDGITVDSSAPTAGSVNDGTSTDVDTQTSTTTIAANWSGFADAQSGITGYEWAIGITSGGTNVQSYTSVGATTSGSNSSLSLGAGTTYFVTVRATNGAGGTTTASSDGVAIPSATGGRASAPPPSSEPTPPPPTTETSPETTAQEGSEGTTASPPLGGRVAAPISPPEEASDNTIADDENAPKKQSDQTTKQQSLQERQAASRPAPEREYFQSFSGDKRALVRIPAQPRVEIVGGGEKTRDVGRRILVDSLQAGFIPRVSAALQERVGRAYVLIVTGTDSHNIRSAQGGARSQGQLSQPALLRIGVDETLVQRLGIGVNTLHLFRYDKETRSWVVVEAPYNHALKAFEAMVSELGVYTVGR